MKFYGKMKIEGRYEIEIDIPDEDIKGMHLNSYEIQEKLKREMEDKFSEADFGELEFIEMEPVNYEVGNEHFDF